MYGETKVKEVSFTISKWQSLFQTQGASKSMHWTTITCCLNSVFFMVKFAQEHILG